MFHVLFMIYNEGMPLKTSISISIIFLLEYMLCEVKVLWIMFVLLFIISLY